MCLPSCSAPEVRKTSWVGWAVQLVNYSSSIQTGCVPSQYLGGSRESAPLLLHQGWGQSWSKVVFLAVEEKQRSSVWGVGFLQNPHSQSSVTSALQRCPPSRVSTTPTSRQPRWSLRMTPESTLTSSKHHMFCSTPLPTEAAPGSQRTPGNCSTPHPLSSVTACTATPLACFFRACSGKRCFLSWFIYKMHP